MNRFGTAAGVDNFFQRVLIKHGVIDKLREAGVEEGDTVSIYDFEFDFVY